MAVEFDIKEGRLTVSADTLTVSAFLAIWEYDKVKTKKKALAMLKHVFHLNDITTKNPLIDSPLNDRERLSKRDCFGNEKYKLTSEEQLLFKNASEWYTELNRRLPWRSLRVVEKKIDQINDHLEDNDISNDNFDDQMKAIEKMDKLHASRDRIEDMVEKQLKKTKVRGGLERSPLEKGMLNIR